MSESEDFNRLVDLARLAERISRLERAFQMLAVGSPYGGIDIPYGNEKVKNLVRDLPHDETQELVEWVGRRLRRYEAQQVETADVLAALTRDLADSGSDITQVLPVTVFTDTHRAGDVTQVSRALRSFLASLGFDFFFEGPDEWGSWFRRSYARSKEALTSQGVKDTLTRAERALEIQTLHIPQAQIDAMQADAAARLIAALDPTPNALVQIGSVLLLKVDGTPIVRNLTQIELSYLEHNKHLYKSPKDALEELARVSGDATRFALPSDEQNQVSRQDT